MSERKTYSISVRLRRTVTEEAFVSVPLNSEVWDPVPDKDGQLHVDGMKVMEVAVHLGLYPGAHWVREDEPRVEPHPIQEPFHMRVTESQKTAGGGQFAGLPLRASRALLDRTS